MTPRDSEADTLAAAIISARKRYGSQAKLAKEANVAERTVKRWEKGTVPQEPARTWLIENAGIPRQLFEKAGLQEEVEQRLRSVEAEVARIRELLG